MLSTLEDSRRRRLIQLQSPASGVVSAVVVNWNGKHYLRACLESLFAQDPPPGEVLVVDNHSEDGSREWVAQHFPRAKVIDTGRNGGPGAARNAGVRAASHERVLLVDNDVVLEPGALAALCARLEEAGAAVVQARALCADRPDTIHYDASRLHVLGLLLLANFFGPLADADDEAVEIGGVVGLCILVRRSAFDAVGGFRESLFFYFEDTDFAWRLRLTGARLWLEPRAVVRHRGGTAGLSHRAGGQLHPARTYFHSRNRWAILLTCLHWRSLLLLLPIQSLYTASHFAFALGKGHGIAWLRGKLSLLRLLPSLARARARVQAARTVSDRELLVAAPLTLHPGIADQGFSAVVRRGLDAIYGGYWRLIRRWCG